MIIICKYFFFNEMVCKIDAFSHFLDPTVQQAHIQSGTITLPLTRRGDDELITSFAPSL